MGVAIIIKIHFPHLGIEVLESQYLVELPNKPLT